jgi:hypothetical protein
MVELTGLVFAPGNFGLPSKSTIGISRTLCCSGMYNAHEAEISPMVNVELHRVDGLLPAVALRRMSLPSTTV